MFPFLPFITFLPYKKSFYCEIKIILTNIVYGHTLLLRNDCDSVYQHHDHFWGHLWILLSNRTLDHSIFNRWVSISFSLFTVIIFQNWKLSISNYNLKLLAVGLLANVKCFVFWHLSRLIFQPLIKFIVTCA